MKLSDKQIEIIKYNNKYKPIITICHGAVRTGKTYLDNFLWLRHVSDFKRKDFIITGHTIASIDRNILKPLYDMFGVDTKLNQRNNFDLFGNKCHCFGGDKYDSYKAMTGMTSYGWLGNEITLQHRNTIDEAFNRCSGDGFRIFWDTNPDYPEHLIKTEYIDKSDEKLNDGRVRIKAWHFELDDNPFLGVEYIENLKKSTPEGMWFDRRIKGLWVAAEGLIYEGFDRSIHVIDPFKIPDTWTRYRGIDFGYIHPFVMLWVAEDNDGRLYVYDEYYKNNTLIRDHANRINQYKELDALRRPIRYKWTVSDHDAQERAEYEKHDVRTRPAIKDVNIGIQKVAERLVVQGDGKPRLFITNNCVNLIREFGKYCWKERITGKPYKEEPVKIDDDGMDTIRYIVMELDSKRKIKGSMASARRLGF